MTGGLIIMPNRFTDSRQWIKPSLNVNYRWEGGSSQRQGVNHNDLQTVDSGLNHH